MKLEFAVNILLLLLLNLLVKPLYIFGIDVQVQNSIGPEQYGLFFSIFNYTLLFQIVLEYGITNYIKREISIDRSLVSPYFSGILLLKSGLALIYFLLVFGFAPLFGYKHQELWIVWYVAVIQLLLTMVSFLRGCIVGLGWYKTDSIFSVLDKLVMILVLGWKLYMHEGERPDLHDFVLVYMWSVAVTAFASFCFLVFKVGVKWVRPDRVLLKNLLVATTPFALVTFLMAVYGRLDAVLLHMLLPDGDYYAGIYAAGYRMLDVYMMFALLFSNLLLPMLSSLMHDVKNAARLIDFAVGALMTLTIVAATGGFVFRREITELLYHHGDDNWYDTVGILFLTIIPVGLSLLYGAAILSIGKLRKQNILFLIGGAVSIIINMLLIPVYKSLGAAISALSVNAFIAISQVIIFYRESDLERNNKKFFLLALYLIVCLMTFFLISRLSIPVIWSLVTGAVLLLPASVILRINKLDIQQIKALISGRN